MSQDGAQSLTQEYAVSSGSSPASKALVTGADGTQASPAATGNKTATISTSTPWVAHLVALMPPLAADGAGTLTTPTTNVSASQTGNTITFTYTAAAGGMNNGSFTLVVPAGWTAPSITSNNAGYTTASTGTVSVAAQTITVSSLTLAGGATATITYGATSGGGPGATATATDRSADLAGPAEGAERGNAHESRLFPEHHRQRRRRLGHPDHADRGGERLADRPHDHLHLHGRNGRHQQRDGHTRGAERLDRTAHHEQQRRLHDRQRRHRFGREPDDHRFLAHDRRRLDVHDHVRDTAAAGRCDGNGDDRRADLAGTVEVDRRRLPGEPRRLTEHHRLRGRRHGHADDTDLGRERVADRPDDHLHLHRRHRRDQQRLRHARRAGRLERTVDHGRERRLHDRRAPAPSPSRPRRSPSPRSRSPAARPSRSPTGRPRAAAPAQPRPPRPARRPGRHRRSPPPPAHSPTSAPHPASPSTPPTAPARSPLPPRSSARRRPAARSPLPTPPRPAASTTARSRSSSRPAGAHRRPPARTPATRPPARAPSPSQARRSPSPHSRSPAARRSRSPTATRAAAGPARLRPRRRARRPGRHRQKSTSAGSLANLGSSPSITVYAADGSGTLTTPTTNVSASQTGRTITFTYTAATGGINNGTVTLVVPAGWSAPSTTGANAGYTTSSTGTLAVAAQTITVSSLTLAGGSTFTITYGSTAGGGPGATATVVHRRADLAGAGEVHLRRLPREPRRLTQHHRQRGRRLRHPDHTDDQRLGEPDRPHDHLHLHRRHGRNQQRHRHARRPRRLDRTLHHRRQRRLHDRRAPAPSPSRARRSPFPRSRSPAARPSRSPTVTRAAAGPVRQQRLRPARRRGRHSRSRPPPAPSRTSAPHRASRSTPPTVQERSPLPPRS